jgi:hypothetical protein
MRTTMRTAVLLSVLAGLVASPLPAKAKAGGKGGDGESSAGVWATLPGERELTVATPQSSDSLGSVAVSATMWAGSGAAKCRINFFVENFSSSPVSVGFVGRSFDAKDQLLDNWVVNIGGLAVGATTGRLFSCSLGATQFTLVPLTGFDWPPIKCVNKEGEGELCPLTFKLTSTVPIVLNKEEKKPEPGDKKGAEKKGGSH